MLKNSKVLYIFLLIILIFSVTLTPVVAQDYSTNTIVKYSVKVQKDTFVYTFEVTNSSPNNYEIYGLTIGAHDSVPTEPPLPFGYISNIKCPKGWFGGSGGGDEYYNGYVVSFGTDWDEFGKNNYIASGSTKRFTFSSTKLAPDAIPFSVGFYDNQGTWGYAFNGLAFKK